MLFLPIYHKLAMLYLSQTNQTFTFYLQVRRMLYETLHVPRSPHSTWKREWSSQLGGEWSNQLGMMRTGGGQRGCGRGQLIPQRILLGKYTNDVTQTRCTRFISCFRYPAGCQIYNINLKKNRMKHNSTTTVLRAK